MPCNFSVKWASANDENEKPCHKCERKKERLKYLHYLVKIILSGITLYWIYKVAKTYSSQPVTSTISMINNNTFAWPTFTFCPHRSCFNKTALTQLSQQYNLTLKNMTFWDSEPFNVDNSSFNWDKLNFSDILSAAEYKRKEDIVQWCEYLNSKYYKTDGKDCMKESSKLGKWSSYNTQYSPCHSFTPTPGTNVGNFLRIYLNPNLCEHVEVSMHQVKDQTYLEATPNLRVFRKHTKNSPQVLTVKRTEFNKVNKETSPCEMSASYSESECYKKAFVKFLIMKSGCFVPEITGYIPAINYPVCRNTSMYKEFSYWKKILENPFDYPVPEELEKDRNKCNPRCHRILYDVDWKNGRQSLGRDNSSNILIYMSGEGMMYMKVDEYFSLTLDMLVSDIGGTLGLFLGVSGLSFLSLFANFYDKLMKMKTAPKTKESTELVCRVI